jgi:hypothetical protein
MRSARVAGTLLLFSLALPAQADSERPDWLVGIGLAWSLPLDPTAGSWRSGRARQDVAGSFVVQRQWKLLFLQLELLGGGLNAAQPGFGGISARGGVFLTRGSTRVYLSAGIAALAMSGDSRFECPPIFACDSRQGSGPAFVAEAGVFFADLEELGAVLAPFAQIILPTFQVTQTIYPGDVPAAVPLMLLGVRLLL